MDPNVLDAYQHVPPDAIPQDHPGLTNWFKELVLYRDIKYENIRKLKAANIRLIAATDSPNLANVAGASLHQEMRLLVERCGFSPIEAVAAATCVPGKLLETLTGIQGLGTIQVGKPADLVILNRDFRNDIRQTENIFMVISDGRIVDRMPR